MMHKRFEGEILITIMSSISQEESRSISENVKWGKRKTFADGKVNMPHKQFLGYQKGQNGQPEIAPKEAEIVRLIYKLFPEGKTFSKIASILTDKISLLQASVKNGQQAQSKAF